MKPISEYNFREIVGKFVIIYDETDLISSEYNSFIAYCYIDMKIGISFKIFGEFKEGKINIFNDNEITLRYSPNIQLDIYSNETNEMIDYKNKIEDIYTPEWIKEIRTDKELDYYRDKQFPDDLLIPVQTVMYGKKIGELIWVRPKDVYNNHIICFTIEEGKRISINSDIYIFKDSNNKEEPVFGVTSEWLKDFNKKMEEINETK